MTDQQTSRRTSDDVRVEAKAAAFRILIASNRPYDSGVAHRALDAALDVALGREPEQPLPASDDQ